MPTITAPGLGSGLDVSSIVSQLVAVEQQPASQRLDLREAELQARLSAYGSLKGAVSTFQSSFSSLLELSGFQSKSATSSDDTVATVVAENAAIPGNFDLSVSQLAEAHSLVTDPLLPAAQFTATSDTIGTGTLTFRFGTTDYDSGTDTYTPPFVQNPDITTKSVAISDGSLSGIRDAVNAADIGVTASIVFDGTNYRLTFAASDTGAENSLEISVADDDSDNNDAAGLSLLSFNGTSNHLLQTQAAQDALLTVNGISIQSATNTLTETLEGMTINLLATGDSTLTVAKDASSIAENISNFVNQHNNLVGTMNELSSYNTETRESGVLNGNAVLRTLDSQLRRILSDPLDGAAAGFATLADIGISRNAQDGTLNLDSAKLSSAIEDNPDAVTALFAAFGVPTDSLVDFSTFSDETLAGDYAVNITQLASQGQAVGSAAANLTITAGSNDALTLSLDGISISVTLTAGTYSAAALATELQTKINASSNATENGSAVTVTEAAGVLTLTSDRYGSASLVSISGGNGATDLLGATPVATDGVDVAGTIGGFTATGSGQILTGSSDAAGLAIAITGGTLGDRGSVGFTRGYANQLDGVLENILASDGIFSSVQDSLNDRIKDIGDDREALTRRISAYEERLRNQFTALDLLVSNLQSTSSFLTSQLAALPVIGSNKKNS